jgi:hypothetical protein
MNLIHNIGFQTVQINTAKTNALALVDNRINRRLENTIGKRFAFTRMFISPGLHKYLNRFSHSSFSLGLVPWIAHRWGIKNDKLPPSKNKIGMLSWIVNI